MSATASIVRLLASEPDWDYADLKRRADLMRQETFAIERAAEVAELQRQAKLARQALVKSALQRARDEFFPDQSVRGAARGIADAVHRRATDDLALRDRVRRFLMQELDHIDDLPDWDRICRLVD